MIGRYALFQLPELAIVGFAIAWAQAVGIVGSTLAWTLFGVWIVKEIALFPFVRAAYEPSDPNVASMLVGKFAVVTCRLAPTGTVRIGPELWRACAAPGTEPIGEGEQVCVKSVEGLTLHVEPARTS